MKAIASFLTKLDRNPATPALTYGGIQSKQNILGGLIGLCFIILAVTMIIYKGIRLIGKKQIVIDSFVRRDFQQIVIPSETIVLSYWFIQNGDSTPIPFQDLPLYGVSSYMLKYELDIQKSVQTQIFRLQPCNSDIQLRHMLCVPGYQLRPKCSFKMLGAKGCEVIVQYHYFTMPCDPALFRCKPYRHGLTLTMMLDNYFFDVNKIIWDDVVNKVVVGVNYQQLFQPLKQDQKKLFYAAVSKVQIYEEQSILPAIFDSDPLNCTSFFFPLEEMGLSEDENSLGAYADFVVYRSGFTEIYKRSFPRIDNILGQIFGLIGLLSVLSLLLCSWINNWLLQKHIRKSLEMEKDLSLKSFVQGQIPFMKKAEDRTEIKDIDIIELYKTVKELEKKLERYEAQNQYTPPQDIQS